MSLSLKNRFASLALFNVLSCTYPRTLGLHNHVYNIAWALEEKGINAQFQKDFFEAMVLKLKSADHLGCVINFYGDSCF